MAGELSFAVVFRLGAALLMLVWPVYRVIRLWLDQNIGPLEACLAIGALLAFIVGIVCTWRNPVGPLLWLLLLTAAVGLTVLDRQAQKRLAESLDDDEIAAARRALEFDAKNAAAYSRLGDVHLKKSHLDAAIEHYQQAVRLAPTDPEEKTKLARAVELQRRQASLNIFCPRCGAENPPDAVRCRNCPHVFSGWAGLTESWKTPQNIRIAKWTAAACLVVALAGSLIGALPPAVVAVLYLLLCVAALVYFCLRL